MAQTRRDPSACQNATAKCALSTVFRATSPHRLDAGRRSHGTITTNRSQIRLPPLPVVHRHEQALLEIGCAAGSTLGSLGGAPPATRGRRVAMATAVLQDRACRQKANFSAQVKSPSQLSTHVMSISKKLQNLAKGVQLISRENLSHNLEQFFDNLHHLIEMATEEA